MGRWGRSEGPHTKTWASDLSYVLYGEDTFNSVDLAQPSLIARCTGITGLFVPVEVDRDSTESGPAPALGVNYVL